MLLTKKKRQEYLKTLGFYDGKIDGKEGTLTKAAYKKLQEKYFTRKQDIDGLYGTNTDTLLRNAYNVYKYCKSFSLEEFKCHCEGKYCTGYPTTLDTNLLKNIQCIRNKYGKTTITSPLRCQKYNDSLTGSVKNSRHIKGKALDFYNTSTKTLAKRKEVMAYWFTLNKPNYSYCNGYWKKGKTTGTIKATYMGNSIHGDIK